MRDWQVFSGGLTCLESPSSTLIEEGPYTPLLVAQANSTSVIIAMIALLSCTRAGEEVGRLQPDAATERPSVRATFRRVQGTVMVKRGTEDEWKAAVEDMALHDNDKVRTGPRSRAHLELTSGSRVVINEDTLLGIADTSPPPGQQRADLTILQGKIDADLKNADQHSLSVTTPTASVRAGREIVFR